METELTVKAGGREFPVQIDGQGKFVANLGMEGIVTAATYDDLVKKARKTKTPFELPFTTVEGKHGTVTGIHATNQNLLVRWEDGKTEQLAYYAGRDYLARLDDDATEMVKQLNQERTRAVDALEKFKAAHKLEGGLRNAVEKAQADAAAETGTGNE